MNVPDTICDYSLRLAEKHVEEYRDYDVLISQHKEAMECRDCEDFLALGIEAFKWLRRADKILRHAAIKGLDVSADAVGALATLYHLWLLPCSHAEERIKQQEEKKYHPRNVKDFREASEFVKREVRMLEMEEQLEGAYRGDVFDEAFWEEAHKMRSG